MEDMLTTEYDGSGRCLVAVRRLSRKTDKTSSPQRQGDQDLQEWPTPEVTSSCGPMTGLRTR